MMPNRTTDPLFQLIRSLEKSEKRNFKLYIKRSSSNEDLKIIQLFDALDKLNEYDERLLIKKMPSVEKPQLANLKTHLYKQLLASLRLLKSTDSLDLQLNEQLDYARILYNKGLHAQSLKILDKAREMAIVHHKYNFMAQVLSLEKKIEALHITRSHHEKTKALTNEALQVIQHISTVAKLSNLAVMLYSWYIQNGHARNKADEDAVKKFFKENLPPNANSLDGFYEKLYLYQSYVWFAFIRQDFLLYYRNSKKWVALFEEEPTMISVETGHYIKGMHNLLNAHFDLSNYVEFEKYIQIFEDFTATPQATKHDNFRIHSFIYLNSAKINWHLMRGTFSQGLALIPPIVEQLKEFELYVDNHRILVFNYKIASMYFGAGDYSTCIDFLQKIINEHTELRTDLQCYSRLMHLMAHYEMGNDDIMEYLTKSVYRFMAKMQNLRGVEVEMLKFIKASFQLPKRQLHTAFEAFLENIKQYENNRFESRAFAYLDIISWVKSKLQNKPMSTIINEKFLQSKHR
jgi:hypothetical protein